MTWFSLPRVTFSLIAVTLAASAAIRLGFGVGEAMARAPDMPESSAPVQCPATPLAVAQALSERETSLAGREAALEERMAALDLAEAAIAARLSELQKAESDLTKVVAMSDSAAEGDLARLTSVYEAMKPADAARLFAAMPVDFAAGFLGRMQPGSAALVLSGMPPETAFAISATIAGRNALAPTE